MEKEEFVEARTRLDKTKNEMSQLLGVSVQAIYSYEQGWRFIPTHVERLVFFLLSQGGKELPKHCWVVKKMPPQTTQRMSGL